MYTMASLDIEGAFNNGTTLAIQQALSDQDVEKVYYRLTGNYAKNENIYSRYW